MTAVKIRRFAHASDNEGVLEVARTLSIPARVRLGIDRSPKFCSFDELLGDPYEILVAEAAGEIVGFIELCLGRFRLFGRETTGVHVPLGGVRPDWRRRGVLTAMQHEGFDIARGMGAEWAYMLVNVNNTLIRGALQRSFSHMIAMDRLLVHGFVMRSPLRLPRGGTYDIRSVDESTWADLEEFVDRRMRASDLSPVLDVSRWRTMPGCRPESYRLARDASGRIVAALGGWAPATAKRALVLDYGRLERAALRPVNRLLSAIGRRPFPLPGRALHLLYGLCPVAEPGHEAALHQLVDRLGKEARDYNALLVAFPEGDPRNRIARSYIHFTNVNIPLLIPLTGTMEKQVMSDPPANMYIEYAFI